MSAIYWQYSHEMKSTMTIQRTNLTSVSSTPIADYSHEIVDVSHLVSLPETIAPVNSRVVVVRPRSFEKQNNLRGSARLSDVINEFAALPGGKQAIEEGRKQVAEKFYGNEPTSLQALRLAKGLSQVELAALLDTTQPRISIYERGFETPGFELMMKMKDVYGVDMNTLSDAVSHAIKRRGAAK